MSNLNIHIPHELSKQEALDRIQQLLVDLKQDQAQHISDVKEKWDGDKGQFQFTAMGFDLSGLIHVNDDSVDIDAKLPLALSFFKSTIEKAIHDRAQTLLTNDEG